ncbi:hypothetical protein FJ872_29990 [Mesorhizobium sp. B2-5-9]|uniref:hypothetical protein n=1 Tax=Mesorhizobium sp. B2-5-9 TaxID=2589921 RepID=UPI00112CE396|nr:hypothetical protein [Mesorhizobium sp. B2-5-9]TPK00957.1 hypothetical protein FJ872_29990 [Mesorhizobium sp. B2-5-9]
MAAGTLLALAARAGGRLRFPQALPAERSEGRDPEVSEKVGAGDDRGPREWGTPRENSNDYLTTVTQATIVVNGASDVTIYTVNSFICSRKPGPASGRTPDPPTSLEKPHRKSTGFVSRLKGAMKPPSSNTLTSIRRR